MLLLTGGKHLLNRFQGQFLLMCRDGPSVLIMMLVTANLFMLLEVAWHSRYEVSVGSIWCLLTSVLVWRVSLAMDLWAMILR